MDDWLAFERAVHERHGVGDTELARAHGIALPRYFTRTARDGWIRRPAGVRVAPWAPASVKQRLRVVSRATRASAAASRAAAAWLHGLLDWPPKQLTVLVQHSTALPSIGAVHVHRARWLRDDDVVEVDHVPTLSVAAMFLSSCGAPRREQRRRLIDALHRGLTTAEEILDRAGEVGPLLGKGTLVELCRDLQHRSIESVFHDDVLEELTKLGYQPGRSARRIDTPDGHGLTPDIPLWDWLVAVEPEGDAFHRTREQRRQDRRRVAAYAGTPWVVVPVDWRDWYLDCEAVLAAIDAAIAAQRGRGIGAAVRPPRRRRAAGPVDARRRP